MTLVNDTDNDVGRLCLLIADMDANLDGMAAYLGDSLPLRVAHWQAGDYLDCIQELRPILIVAAAETLELADKSAALLRALVSDYHPTIVGLAPHDNDWTQSTLTMRQLGASARARLRSLAALELDD